MTTPLAPDDLWLQLRDWLRLVEKTLPPVEPGPEGLFRTEHRAVVLQLERLMDDRFCAA